MRDYRIFSAAVRPSDLPWLTLRSAEERRLIEQRHPDGADQLAWFDPIIEGCEWTIDNATTEAREGVLLRPEHRWVAGYRPDDLKHVDFAGPGGHRVIYRRTGDNEGVLAVVVFGDIIPDWAVPLMEAAKLMPAEMV